MIFGAGAPFHSFGIERPYDALPVERSTSGAGAKMSLSKEVFPPAPGTEAGDDASAGSGGLAFATTKQVPTLKDSELSQQVEQVSNNMSERGEFASNQSEQVLNQRCEDLQRQLNDEYERAGNLELQREEAQEQLLQCKNKLADIERQQRDTDYMLKQSGSSLEEEQNKVKTLETRITKLEEDLARQEDAIRDKVNQVNNSTADYQGLFQSYSNALSERDDYRVKFFEKKLEFDDLQNQWETDRERIAELEQAIKEYEDSKLVAELENDVARLNANQEQYSRTIDVKDERISHLEGLLQKEKERNLRNADETARTAAASPVDDQRHIGSLGGTLEEELSSFMLDERDFFEREPSEYEPELQSLSPIHVAASVNTVAAHVPRSTIAISQAASVEPRKAVSAPPFTISFNESVSTAPQVPRVPIQTLEFCKPLSTLPVEPARVPLSFHDVCDIVSFAPDQPANAPLVYYSQKAASTDPIEPARAPLAINDVHNVASYAPKQPTATLLAIHEQKPVSTMPVEPTGASLAFDNVRDVASFAPEQPAPVASTIVGHEIANFAPKEPTLPVLTVDITEAASTRPIARQITNAELSTQTDAPATTTSFSTQTDAPALTSQLLSHATRETAPVKPSTQIATIEPTNRIAPVMVTGDIKPIEQVLLKPEPQRHTTTIGVQANIKDAAEERAMASKPLAMATASKKAGLTDWIPMLLAVLFAVYSLVLQAELATWKNANGVGFGGGYGNVASRSGAYGNGRHLFGFIPMGMDIGNSWVSEQIARHMSLAISLIEDWAGITNEPMY
jgi:hypothetical protein